MVSSSFLFMNVLSLVTFPSFTWTHKFNLLFQILAAEPLFKMLKSHHFRAGERK